MIGTWEFFGACGSVDGLRAEYRKLAFKHHPDMGGDTATMQRLNAEYNCALRWFSENQTGAQNTESKYTYNADAEASVVDKLYAFIARKVTGVEVELVGTWIWADTQRENVAAHSVLKQLNFQWSPKRRRWYYAPTQMAKSARKHWHSKLTMEEIRMKYGSQRAARASHESLN